MGDKYDVWISVPTNSQKWFAYGHGNPFFLINESAACDKFLSIGNVDFK